MKKLVLLIVALWIVGLNTVYAYDVPAKLRVGMESNFKEVDSVSLGNDAITFGYDESGVFRSAGQLRNAKGFVLSSVNYYLVKVMPSLNMEQAKSAARSYSSQGYTAIPVCFREGAWAVYLCFSSEAEAKNFGPGEHVGVSSRAVAISANRVTEVIFDNPNSFPQFGALDQRSVVLGGKEYRGYVEACRHSGKKLTAVNVVSMDEYLYSTVPYEIPPSWNAEALKAQAVAMRSYAAFRVNAHGTAGYDLCDLPHCQNYPGISTESDTTTRAVQDTSGYLIYYDEKPINAVFSSSSGGVTEDSINVWQRSEPYLQSVKEINEPGAKEWVRSFSLSELTELAKRNNLGVGTVSGVTVISSTSSGRITEMTVHGSSGSKSVYKEGIRTFFSASKGGSLESRNFMLQGEAAETGTNSVYVSNGSEVVNTTLNSMNGVASDGVTNALTSFSILGSDSGTALSTTTVKASSSGDTVVFVGRGWGHGVGMSQYGAQGMAQLGYTYEQILEHYYTGVSVY